MNQLLVTFAALAVASSASTATAQSSHFNSLPPKPAVSTPRAPGGFLVGTDDCASPHRALPPGDQFSQPFTTGTTGTAGQTEALCYFFGTTGIDDDVWFDWSSTLGGVASVSTCFGTTVDTKIAVWPGTTGCPVDGTALACADDSCGLQTTVTWTAAPNTLYTFQLGTFPGAGGGSGTFDVTVDAPPPCGRYDDGEADFALGLLAGGETGWLHYVDCLLRVDDVSTAYGLSGGANPPNGAASTIAVYEDVDCDADANTGPPALLWSVATVTSNVGTDVFNSNPTGGVLIGSRCSWVMATAVHAPDVQPAPVDLDNFTLNAWITGQSPAGTTLNIADLNANSASPVPLAAGGLLGAWLLRASGVTSTPAYPTACFGSFGCPCDNEDFGGGGCANSTGAGAQLSGGGVASLSNDTFSLAASDVPDGFGLFFQGDLLLDPPVAFGDGLRCCGEGVVRIGTYLATGNATDTVTGNLQGGFGPPISALPGQNLSPGSTRCYQYWYRDNAGPCGTGINLSNAVEATWVP